MEDCQANFAMEIAIDPNRPFLVAYMFTADRLKWHEMCLTLLSDLIFLSPIIKLVLHHV
jgi:hypothetical protein